MGIDNDFDSFKSENVDEKAQINKEVWERRIGQKGNRSNTPENEFVHQEVLSGYNILAYTTYYPKRFSNAPQSVNEDRQMVYAFKDGLKENSVRFAKIISKCLNRYIDKQSLNRDECTIVIIPASTIEKTEKRYKQFTEIASKELGITNGYSSIMRDKDRETLLKEGRIIDRKLGLVYDFSETIDKHVFLFDDILTSGKSFLQNADTLSKNGCKSVTGVFLAKTYKENPGSNWVIDDDGEVHT